MSPDQGRRTTVFGVAAIAAGLLLLVRWLGADLTGQSTVGAPAGTAPPRSDVLANLAPVLAVAAGIAVAAAALLSGRAAARPALVLLGVVLAPTLAAYALRGSRGWGFGDAPEGWDGFSAGGAPAPFGVVSAFLFVAGLAVVMAEDLGPWAARRSRAERRRAPRRLWWGAATGAAALVALVALPVPPPSILSHYNRGFWLLLCTAGFIVAAAGAAWASGWANRAAAFIGGATALPLVLHAMWRAAQLAVTPLYHAAPAGRWLAAAGIGVLALLLASGTALVTGLAELTGPVAAEGSAGVQRGQ